MISEALFSSQKDNWETPQDFFDELDNEFHFTLDPCSDDQNYKCEYHFTKDDDGLSKDWGGADGILQPAIRKKIDWTMDT